MTLTAGALSQVSVTSTGAVLHSAVATSGTAPYSYQWYRSTVTGFSPGAGTLISGATSLDLTDSGLVPNTTYFYVVKVTDSASPAATANATQLAVTTIPTTLSQNSFAQAPVVGQLDLPYNYNTKACVISSTQSGALYQGMAVKLYTTAATGVPQVVGVSSDQDEVFGFINFNQKNVSFVAGDAVEVSQAGNVMWLYSTDVIVRGAKVCVYSLVSGGVQPVGASPAADVVGWAVDGASAAGQLMRVNLLCPSFLTA